MAYFQRHPLAAFSEPGRPLALHTDVDGDGTADSVTTALWAPIRTGNRTITQSRGLWRALVAADFDGDGDTDLVAANHGLNTRLIKPDGGQRVRRYRRDFDANGHAEDILAYHSGGDRWYPTNNRDELGKYLPGLIRKRFPTNEAFAGKTVAEIFGDDLRGATVDETDRLATTYFANDGRGNFTATPLPAPVQYAPVFALAVADLNDDGYPDLVGGGNQYGVSPYQGRYDAGRPFVLYGGPAGLGQLRELNVPGEIRDIRIGGDGSITFGRNNAPTLVLPNPDAGR